MSPVIWTLIGIIVIFVMIAIWNVNEGWTIGSIISAVVLGLFGLGMFGTINVYREEIHKATIFEIARAKHTLLVSTDKGDIIFKGGDVDMITDSTEFYWIVKFNHYNFETTRILGYKK